MPPLIKPLSYLMRFNKAFPDQQKNYTPLSIFTFFNARSINGQRLNGQLLSGLLLTSICTMANSAPYDDKELTLTQQEANSFTQIISNNIQRLSTFFSANTSTTNTSTNTSTNSNKKIQPAPKVISAETTNSDKTQNDAAEDAIEFVDIWPRIRNDFQLPTNTGRNVKTNVQNKILQEELNWYANNPEYIQRVLERAEPFLFYILEETKKHNLPTELVLLPIVESAFRPFAYSHGRAAGLWQFIPSTGRAYGLKQNWWYDGRRDIYASTQAALKYLTRLRRVFDGDWLLALAAYNSGEGTVKKAIRKNKRRNKPTDFWSLTLPKETVRYVPRLLALKKVIKNPEDYNIDLHFIADQPGFETVKIKSQIDLALAAELAGMELEALYRYNPGFNRWATDPDGPHQLLLPTASSALFKEKYASLPASKHLQWQRHKIKRGETLGRIASQYRTSVTHLKKANKMRSNALEEGEFILIPVSSKQRSHYTLSSSERLKSLQHAEHKNKKRIKHTVKNGESVWSIAKKYHVKRRELAKWNSLAIKDSLNKGQKLIIWKKSKNHTPSTAVEDSFSDTITSIHYTVKSGDSLSRIANKYHLNVRDIHRWNSIKGKYLKPGQRLKLYIDVTEQSNQG